MLILCKGRLEIGWGELMRSAGPGLLLGVVCLVSVSPVALGMQAHWLLRLSTGIGCAVLGTLGWAWFFPASLRHGPNDILAQLAGRIPLAAFKQRWENVDEKRS
jgi:hypothetical protein